MSTVGLVSCPSPALVSVLVSVLIPGFVVTFVGRRWLVTSYIVCIRHLSNLSSPSSTFLRRPTFLPCAVHRQYHVYLAHSHAFVVWVRLLVNEFYRRALSLTRRVDRSALCVA